MLALCAYFDDCMYSKEQLQHVSLALLIVEALQRLLCVCSEENFLSNLWLRPLCSTHYIHHDTQPDSTVDSTH